MEEIKESLWKKNRGQ